VAPATARVGIRRRAPATAPVVTVPAALVVTVPAAHPVRVALPVGPVASAVRRVTADG
jgi:hypothetical protein